MSELIVTCPDESSTRQAGGAIASLVKNGGFIELIGDVGSGKTTFVKGLAKGLNYNGDISSPSFALKNVYEGKPKISHFDLYRLDEPGLVKHDLEEAMKEEGSLVIIEWARSAEDILPSERITVIFSLNSEDSRELRITMPEGLR